MIAFAFFGNKGGIGKTETALNTAHGITLAAPDIKVAYWDVDGQLSGMTHLNIDASELPGYGKVIMDGVDIKDILIEARPNLFAFHTDLYLPGKTEKYIGLESNPYKVFKKPLDQLEKLGIDILIIDCGPGQSYMNSWIMEYADHIILMAQLREAAMSGIATAIGFLEAMDVEIDKVSLIVPNMHDARKSSSDEHVGKLHVKFGDVVTNYVSFYEAIEKAWEQKKTIWEMPVTEHNKVGILQQQYSGILGRMVDLIG